MNGALPEKTPDDHERPVTTTFHARQAVWRPYHIHPISETRTRFQPSRPSPSRSVRLSSALKDGRTTRRGCSTDAPLHRSHFDDSLSTFSSRMALGMKRAATSINQRTLVKGSPLRYAGDTGRNSLTLGTNLPRVVVRPVVPKFRHLQARRSITPRLLERIHSVRHLLRVRTVQQRQERTLSSSTASSRKPCGTELEGGGCTEEGYRYRCSGRMCFRQP